MTTAATLTPNPSMGARRLACLGWAVEKLFGTVDLDPHVHGEPDVPAVVGWRLDQGPLSKPWVGRVYVRPPYGRELGEWVEHLLQQYRCGNIKEVVALLPSRPDTRWFRALREFPRCFVVGRLSFGRHAAGAPFPSMVVYMGPRHERFAQVFAGIGDVYRSVVR